MPSNITMPLKQCSDNLEFSRSLTNTIFAATRSPDEAFPPVRLCSEATAIILILALAILPGYIEKWLRMRQLHYTNIFWTLLSVRWTMFFAAFVFAFLFLWINLRQAAITSADFDIGDQAEKPGFWSRLNVVTRSGFKFSPKFVMLDIALDSAAAA